MPSEFSFIFNSCFCEPQKLLRQKSTFNNRYNINQIQIKSPKVKKGWPIPKYTYYLLFCQLAPCQLDSGFTQLITEAALATILLVGCKHQWWYTLIEWEEVINLCLQMMGFYCHVLSLKSASLHKKCVSVSLINCSVWGFDLPGWRSHDSVRCRWVSWTPGRLVLVAPQ